MSLTVIPHLFPFWNSLRKVDNHFSLMFDRSYWWIHLALDFSWLGGLLITDSIFLWVSSLFRFSIHDSILVCCMFLGTYSFLLGYLPGWQIIIHSSLIILCISVVSVVTSPLSVLVLFIWVICPFFFFFFWLFN